MTQPQRLSPAIPWLLLSSGFVLYVCSLVTALLKVGDAPATAGLFENFLLAGWLLAFSSAVVAARATKDPPTFHGIFLLSFTLTTIGYVVVL